MSKTVIIPDLGQNPLKVTNGRECYSLKVGDRYIVPDWVASLLENAQANRTAGVRDTAGPHIAVPKTENMTQPVGSDTGGKLWTIPSSGGNFAIVCAEAYSLEPGSDATVETEQTEEGTILYFGIPQGQKGDRGATGPQGPKGDKGEPGDSAVWETMTAADVDELWAAAGDESSYQDFSEVEF